MKKQLYIYIFLIALYVAYNLFFQDDANRGSAAINIIIASLLFLYMAYLAFSVLKKINKK